MVFCILISFADNESESEKYYDSHMDTSGD